MALKFLQSIAKGRLLEIGCGAGVQADAAYKLGWSVSATDITIPLLIQAHETFTGPHWVASTAEQLPFREATFDAVLMLGVIGYVNDPAVVLRHVHRMLRPDGYLIISWARDHTLMESASKMVSIIPDRLYMTMKEAVRGNSTRTQPGETNSTDPSGTDPSGTDTDTTNFYTAFNRFWNRRDFVELLRTAGFTPEDVQGVNFGQFKFMDHAIWPERIDAALSATFERLSATPGFRRLGNLTRTHVALARRTGMS